MKLQIVTARTGVAWVKEGIRTFWRQPLALSGLFFIFLGLEGSQLEIDTICHDVLGAKHGILDNNSIVEHYLTLYLVFAVFLVL